MFIYKSSFLQISSDDYSIMFQSKGGNLMDIRVLSIIQEEITFVFQMRIKFPLLLLNRMLLNIILYSLDN